MKGLSFAVAVIAVLVPFLASAGMAEHVARKKIDGIDVIVYPTEIKDVVTFMGALPAGDAFAAADHVNVATATVAVMMLDRGTTKEDKFAIAKKLGSVGASLRFEAQGQAVTMRGRCLKKDLPMVIDLIAEQLRMPAFSQGEFDKARQLFIGQMKDELDDLGTLSAQAFRRAVFPPGHPNYEPTIDEYLSAAQTLTLDEVKAFHRKYYGPDHMTLVLVGDVGVARIQDVAAGAFRGWKGGVDYLRDAELANRGEPANQTITVEVPGKASTSLTIGQATGLHEKDPDTLALAIGSSVLGSGFTSRLMHAVRDNEGLTYGISARISNDIFADGSWQISATFAPQLLDRGTTSTQRELRRWWSNGVSEQELAAYKTNIIGRYRVDLADTFGMAQTLLYTILKGRDVTWLDQYPKEVNGVSLQHVNAAIKQYLNPEKMVTVKAGTTDKS